MFRRPNDGYNEIKNPADKNPIPSKTTAPTDTSSKDEGAKFGAKKFTLYGTSATPQTKAPDAPASKSLMNRLFGFN